MSTNTIRIMALDPGTTTTGCCILTIDPSNIPFVNYANTINGEQLAKSLKYITHVHGFRYAKITGICNTIDSLLHVYNPSIIYSEAPFFNPTRPQAYSALVETVSMIRQTVYRYNPSVFFHTIDPSTIKKTMGVSGISGDKSLMDTALRNSNLFYDADINQALFDEHTIDALCVAITGLRVLCTV